MSIFDDVSPQDTPPEGVPLCNAPGCSNPVDMSSYGGRGRKPTKCEEHKRAGSSTGSTRRTSVSDRDLTLACDNMHQLYSVLVVPFAMVHPDAGQAWVEQIDGLDMRNRAILANNKDLVKKINSVGEKGGSFAFAVSHLIALAPVVMVVTGYARATAAERRAQREAEAAQWTATQEPTESATPFDPDAAFIGVTG